MKQIISMPRVDPAMEKGTIIKIMKKIGEKVAKNEPILKIMTEKATFELNSPYEGYVTRIFHFEGEELNVGEPILEISESFEIIEEKKEEKEIFATPAARRIARELGVDLRKIKGSGPQGRITQEDVLEYFEKSKSAIKEIQLSPVRKLIAQRVEFSHKEIPQLTVQVDLIAEKILEDREKNKFSFDSYFIFASSRALLEFELFNSEFKDGKILKKDSINIAFAVAVGNELYMPVIKNADKKSLREIEYEHNSLVEKAKNNNLKLEDIQDPTFAITNLGAYNVLFFNPFIFPSNSAILGIGSLHYGIFIDKNVFSFKPVITLSLSFDHRVADGFYAARFLSKIKEILEHGPYE